MNSYDQRFLQRSSRIPFHGVGLSVDVYSPPLLELVQELTGQGLPFAYLEIFKAPINALETIRSSLPHLFCEYHADGLWVTQPDLWEDYPIQAELDEAVSHLRSLRSHWINQECATKQMAGYSFGTYLPPLLTQLSAEVTASNTEMVQDRLGRGWNSDQHVMPLLLLETPPLTYFACGNLSYLEFFRQVCSQSACGLVLDIGHLWTVYRYAGYARTHTMLEFLELFLTEFPVHRVVQIHLAGLSEHAEIPLLPGDEVQLPPWIDAHDAVIPEVLYEMLNYLLSHDEFPSLKGIALEVDTKPIPRILEDYGVLQKRLSGWEQSHRWGQKKAVGGEPDAAGAVCHEGTNKGDRQRLLRQYEDWVKRMITGTDESHREHRCFQTSDEKGLDVYRKRYLPTEVLEWGGDVREMFPTSCTALERRSVDVSRFLSFWLERPRPNTDPFNFFLLKVGRFVQFVQREARDLLSITEQEAAGLYDAYDFANRLTASGDPQLRSKRGEKNYL